MHEEAANQKRTLGRSRRLLVGGVVVALLVAGWAATRLWRSGEGVASLFLRRDATWAAMQERGSFRVGLDPSFPPFEQLDDSGAPQGYDVDLALALAQQWGLQPEIVALGFDSLVDALRAARVDAVISAMPYDERLTRDVTYSGPYFEAGIRLAVRDDSTIAGVEDLVGKRVGVEWGSTGDMIARQLQRDRGVQLEIVPYESPDAALDAVLGVDPDAVGGAAGGQGRIDAVLIDQVSMRLAQGRGAMIKAVGPVLESSPYVIITPRRAGTLGQAVQDSLAALAEDGTLSRLEDRWFGRAQLQVQPTTP